MSNDIEKSMPNQTGTDMLLNADAFSQAYRVAELFANSQLVPQHLRNKPEDCFIALHMAHRLREDPLMVAQNIVIIHGTAGWKAQWLIARANRSDVFKGRIKFRTEGTGDSLKVTAYATLSETGDTVEASADMKMAKAEGWTKNPKYQSMPEQMLSYRAASFLVRLHCPEATMGYQTAEEVEDLAASGKIKNVTPSESSPSAQESLSALTSETTAEPESEPQQPEPEQPPQAAVLFNADGEEIGQYQKAGSYLNALDKAIDEAGDRDTAQALWKANADTIERIAGLEKHEARVAELSEKVAGKAAATEAAESGQEDVF